MVPQLTSKCLATSNGYGFKASHDGASAQNPFGTTTRAAEVKSIMGNFENNGAIFIPSVNVLIANNAKCVVQQTGGHALIPFFFRFGRLRKNHVCLHFSIICTLHCDEPQFQRFTNGCKKNHRRTVNCSDTASEGSSNLKDGNLFLAINFISNRCSYVNLNILIQTNQGFLY